MHFYNRWSFKNLNLLTFLASGLPYQKGEDCSKKKKKEKKGMGENETPFPHFEKPASFYSRGCDSCLTTLVLEGEHFCDRSCITSCKRL